MGRPEELSHEGLPVVRGREGKLAQHSQTGPIMVLVSWIQLYYVCLTVCKDKVAQCEGQPAASSASMGIHIRACMWLHGAAACHHPQGFWFPLLGCSFHIYFHISCHFDFYILPLPGGSVA
jgi:hypothetical protein